jgi:hypothetical protein
VRSTSGSAPSHSKSKLPIIFQWNEQAEAGGLLSYGPSLTETWRQSAVIVAKILKGAKAADMSVEQPAKLELVINQKIAKALGVEVRSIPDYDSRVSLYEFSHQSGQVFIIAAGKVVFNRRILPVDIASLFETQFERRYKGRRCAGCRP